MNKVLRITRKLFHIIFSIFLMWQSIQLINRLSGNEFSRVTDIVLNSIFINLFVTGIFTIVYSFPVYKLIPSMYYKINRPKHLKSFCKIIKMGLFKKMLLYTLWNKKQNKKYYFDGSRNGLREFEIVTMKSEFGHFLAFIILIVIAVYIGIKGSLFIAVVVFIINILFNFYPFILQRYHRMRIEILRQAVYKE